MNKSFGLKEAAALARTEILSLKPYAGKPYLRAVKLDANENPFPWPEGMREELLSAELSLNRYPDGEAQELKRALVRYTGVSERGILPGNGSDELIQLVFTVFGGEGRAVVLHPPTFVMYEAAARVTGTKVEEVPLRDGLHLDVEGIIQAAAAPAVHVIILCNPNNPTGSRFAEEDILEIVRESGKVVVVDEAYAEFSGASMVGAISRYPNLLIMRTFSKAFGLAGLRLGYLLGQDGIIDLVNRARQPFNVNAFTQKAGVIALRYEAEYRKQVAMIREEIGRIYRELNEIPGVRVYPTAANFVLFQCADTVRLAEDLASYGFQVRNLGDIPVLGPSLRMSSGLPEENKQFLRAVRETMSK
ncbi:histidinol-phosphate transaminase [Acididesulfobacillus acetoxydans]|uniref:Histidinol-phosphate aminotransferase n=1 Tax=Acididesulfobacillus acetoxydans TaxID=1561005 RepID=A0A8S0W986_9FIRM|nr:histidinol-phosphate transaminase [Acididesulfobacillus acetoxydans]CAA7602409.1 histidinol-phosphate transaminase [Acididesulfobacillus acetoxydans]CEJ08356.1 Histidinol-phosphate aminotransferase [Acididesulfobacillus acetoxydans]